MTAFKGCVICEKPLSATRNSLGSPICDALTCDIALRNHLQCNLPCCCSCGRPVSGFHRKIENWAICSRPECQSNSAKARSFDASFCKICGLFLESTSQLNTSELCSNPICEQIESNRRTRERQRILAEYLEKRRSKLEEMAHVEALDIRPELKRTQNLKTITLPFLQHDLSQPTAERIAKVRDGFLRIAKEAFANRENNHFTTDPASETLEDIEPSNSNSEADKVESRFSRLNGLACGTCGGRCCNLGGDEAFLNADKFQAIFRERTTITPEELVDEYISKIPSESFVNSCIFHGLHGCTLNREQRAVTCNTYLCSSLQILRGDVQDGVENFILAATNFRDHENLQLDVLRIRYDDGTDLSYLKDAPEDRMP